MMQTLAECYETGGYYIAAEGLEEEGFTVANEKKVAEALRKYNPEMNANALAVIQTLLLQENEISKESLEELYSATSRMRWFKDPNLVNILIEALSSRMSDFPEQNLGIRSDIIHTLGQLNDVRAVEPLISALKDNFQLVRYRAAIGLGEIGDSRAIDPLVESLEDIDEQVRNMASHSLVSLKAIEPIILAARHCNVHVREQAAWMLGEIEDSRVMGLLSQLINDDDPNVVTKARFAIKKISQRD
ncbi:MULTISPECIES: HEAT repeat domain-containing protein [Pseudanabaena]|uniref:PBS lyase HEAT domain protein repeat-containing protein n=2 Tax=Pseudanabaena TaxID=1152 RepID=L8MRX7_9CYAN|nr:MULTISPECIES: HEAT repeat domain-containing protein [Pseudanabaena]ELS30196.1 PBS lyase HEAT domain protein repeat-containing protein [Pseudanabaena biceps PCC 7429]MDG3497514.1 HEAT repeat domain-containing protein [Pseudanabaena catenata USMAC16]